MPSKATDVENFAPPAREPSRSRPARKPYAAVFTLWALIGLGLSLSGALLHAPRFIVPFVILTGPFITLIAYHRSRAFRAWTGSIPLATLLLIHLPRAPIGAMFLVQSAQGILHPTFANVAGPGDILAGGLAAVGLLLLPAATPPRRRLLQVINAVGLVDMVLVIITAQRILLLSSEYDQLALVRQFPFSMIPLVLVPWILISHGLVFDRLRQR